jgi:endoglucanase
MKRAIYGALLLFAGTVTAQQSPFIHVDQFGYHTDAEKVAVLSNPITGYNAAQSYAAPALLELRDSASQAVVWSGAPTSWNSGATHTDSGDQGWWLDFSAFNTPGTYYVYDPSALARSAYFKIGDNPYGEVLIAAAKMFYYNRCNYPKAPQFAGTRWADATNFLGPLQDANCRFIVDPSDYTLERNMFGGWFDAGDYNKYVTFTWATLTDLLYAYIENPAAFGDASGIPESGNGLPDILDEIRWELDWLKRMSNPDGSVHIKLGSRNYSENISSPPSANTHQRYYGPICTSASATVAAVFSLSALVLDDFPSLVSYAADLRARAATCFAYVLPFCNSNTLDDKCDDGSIVSGDADVSAAVQKDMLLCAAVYLFEATGDTTYLQFITANYAGTSLMTSGYWSPDYSELQDALLRYTQLPNAEPTSAAAILASATTAATNNWNDFFGWTDADLYRAYMPDWSYHWGSNRPKADYATLNLRLAGLGIATPADLQRKAAEQIHYFHGVNPLGLVYLSNMYAYGADHSVNELYHTWFADGSVYDHALTSPKGPAPGFLVGGPNRTYTNASYSPPFGQPAAKSYLDYNTGFPANSWEITEPAIYYQASYIRLLAHYASPPGTPVHVQAPDPAQAWAVAPHPVQDRLGIYPLGQVQAAEAILFDALGRVVWKGRLAGATQVDASDWAAGVYLLQVQSENAAVQTMRLVKQ